MKVNNLREPDTAVLSLNLIWVQIDGPDVQFCEKKVSGHP